MRNTVSRVSLRGMMTLFLSSALLFSCARTEQKSLPGAQAEAPAETPSTELLYADGWSDLTLMANYAKTVLDRVAHFNTSRNACGKSAYGVLPHDTWNKTAKLINLAIKEPALPEPRCTEMREYSKMDGTAEVNTDNGKRMLFEVRGWDMCTTVKDPDLAKELFAAITDLVITADKEECANGWGG